MRTKRVHFQSRKLKEQAVQWACNHYKHVYFFTNNGLDGGFKTRLYVSNHRLPLEKLDDLKFNFNKYHCGWISYGMKNEIENLKSENRDSFKWEKLGFIEAEVLIEFKGGQLVVESRNKPEKILSSIYNTKIKNETQVKKLQFSHEETKEEYIKNVNSLRKHIEEGDIYEACYCTELLSKNTELISPVSTFFKLCRNSPKPFASFIKSDQNYLLGASPERFLHKKGGILTSQPIKGTIKRGKNKEEDNILKKKLFLDPKERAENLMIVDLVRNDLARISQPGSVKVEELFGIYTFPNVHQMISTICSKIKENSSFNDIIEATFPMGSMTGAPKIKAMELIEKYETFARGLYSGTVGYFDKDGFDFNVTIRSLQYKADKKTIGLHVGSAITYDSIPEKEYTECITKAESVKKALEA